MLKERGKKGRNEEIKRGRRRGAYVTKVEAPLCSFSHLHTLNTHDMLRFKPPRSDITIN
jgi:hypothetical protein